MNDILKAPFLRTSRNFPEDPKLLQSEINRSYVDIARGVNNRTIGFFVSNKSIANGEQWFINKNSRQQGLRQVFKWDDNNLTIAHGIDFDSLTNFIRIYGSFFGTFAGGATFWCPLPYVDATNVTNQIMIQVNSTNIVITKGATAPAVSKGTLVLEWLGNI